MVIKRFEQVVSTFMSEDGGMARTIEFVTPGGNDIGLFVKVCSWDEKKIHEEFGQIFAERVRVTIEVLEDQHGE